MTRLYFIECTALASIKIGIASDVGRRRASLQTANSHPLVVLVSVPGKRADENRLHRRFRSERIRGEWFRADGPVRAFADSLRGMTPEQVTEALRFEPSLSPDEIAWYIEATERLEGAALAVMRELGPERCVAEIAASLGRDRAPLEKTIAKVIAGENYLRAEWLPWLCHRSAEVRTILLSTLADRQTCKR